MAVEEQDGSAGDGLVDAPRVEARRLLVGARQRGIEVGSPVLRLVDEPLPEEHSHGGHRCTIYTWSVASTAWPVMLL